MDYHIRRKKSELESTGFMEIGPGRYSGSHWQDGFLFIWEDAFSVAEGIVERHFPDYDHLGMNEIPKVIGEKIAAEWHTIGMNLPHITAKTAGNALNLPNWLSTEFAIEFERDRAAISTMLCELAEAWHRIFSQEDWVCILGV